MSTFQESLRKSESYEQELDTYYKQNHNALFTCKVPAGINWYQQNGIDRFIHDKNGKTWTVEEKIREKWYPDMLFEVWSCKEKQTLGWAQKVLECDYFLYCCPKQNQYKLYKYADLKRAWFMHRDRWIEIFELQQSVNEYTTEFVCVPFYEIDRVINEWNKSVQSMQEELGF